MKYISIIIILLYFSSQLLVENNRAIESKIPKVEILTKFNKQYIVYRGINNPIKINIENNFKYTASGDGLVKFDELGNYKLSPRTGKEMIIIVVGTNKKGEKFEVSQIFEIKDIGIGISQFNGESCNKCEIKLSRKELSIGEVSYAFPDLLIDGLETKIISFKIKLPNKPIKQIKGNKIKSSLLLTDIQKLKRGSQVQIFDIQLKSSITNQGSLRICKTTPILIKIIG